MTDQEIHILEAAMQRRLSAMPQRIRPFTTEYGPLPGALILTGPRGCGKSTFLLHHARGAKILYMSMDNPIIGARPLYDIASEAFMLGYEGVILDEVHFAADWSLHLKALYDDFPTKKIWASDSSTLVMRRGVGDLSRRYVDISMPLMSFREYLYIESGEKYPIYKLGEDVLPVNPDAKILSSFQGYRDHGTRPFYQEGDFMNRYISVINKVLDADIPYFLPNITDNNLRLMRAIIGTLATASVPRVQVNSLCQEWGIGAQKLYQLLFVMEKVKLISIVRYPNDNKANSVGAKMLFADPCAYRVLGGDQGTEREAFVASCFANAGYEVFASKDETKGDFVVMRKSLVPGERITLEVGGKSKKPKSADYVLRDNTDYPTACGIPMWLIAMMW